MAKKFLGRVVAGVALGGASLLVGAPGIAVASEPHGPDATKKVDVEVEVPSIFTHPKWVKPGHKIKIIELCEEAQDEPWAWSEITGEVDLHKPEPPKKHHGYGEGHEGGSDWGGNSESGSDWSGNSESGSNGGGYGGGTAVAEKKDDKKDDKKKDDNKDKKPHAATKGGKKDDKEHEEKFVYVATVKIPWDATPGHYKLTGQCAEGELLVAPKGWVNGGDGGNTGTNTALAASGAGMLGAAGLGGILLMRRRRTDGSVA